MSANKSDDLSTENIKKAADVTSPTCALQSIQARKTSRRSAIFRRDVLSSEADYGSDSESFKSSSPIISQESDSNATTGPKQEEPRISSQEYESKLLLEKEEWSKTRRMRSNEYHKLKSRKPSSITLETCADFLTEEDKKFMSERPDYRGIANDVNAFYEEVFTTVELKKKLLRGVKTVISDFGCRMEVDDREIANLSVHDSKQ